MRRGGFRHGLGDRAHAADRMAPDAFLSVRLAKAMVHENIGRARRVGARIIADDAVEAEGGLDRSAFEPAIEEIAGRGREEIEQIPLQVEPEGSHSVGYPTGLDHSAIVANGLPSTTFGGVSSTLARKISAMAVRPFCCRLRMAAEVQAPIIGACGPSRHGLCERGFSSG